MVYKWSSNHPSIVSAQVAGERMEELANTRKGLTKDTLLDSARPDEDPLHPLFDWVDSSAAEKWRRHQAGDAIRSIVTVVEAPAKEKEPPKHINVRAMVNVSDGPNNRGRYEPVNVVLRDADMRSVMLLHALEELKRFKAKYSDLSELTLLFGCIDEAVDNYG